MSDEMDETAGRCIAAASDAAVGTRPLPATAPMAHSVVERLRSRAAETARREEERPEIAALGAPGLLGALARVWHEWHVVAGGLG